MTKGYQYPETVDPGEAVCIPVYIPNDRAYIAAFFGSLDFLATWLAWERDDLNTGAAVAAVWKPWVDFTKLMFDTQGCTGGEAVDLRQNPTLPCRLERDDGEGWVQWADLSACLTIDYTPPAPYPDEPPADAPDRAAVSLTLWLKEELTEIVIDLITASEAHNTIVNNVITILQEVSPLDDVSQAAEDFVTDLEARTEIERQAKKANSEWEELYKRGHCVASGDGRFLDWAADAIFQGLNNSADWLFQALNDLADVIDGADMTRMVNAEGDQGDGAGFGWTEPTGEECASLTLWVAEIDFTTGQHGFELMPVPGVQGEYVAGVGWRSTSGNVCNRATGNRIIIWHPFATSARLLTCIATGNYSSIAIRDASDCVGLGTTATNIPFPGYDSDPDEAVSVGNLTFQTYGGTGHVLTAVEIWGTGDNPFEGE